MAIFIASSASAQTVLIDLGNSNSFRGVDVPSGGPDANGNHWNSVWAGDFYTDLIDITGTATTIDFGFSLDGGNDSYNGPAGATSNPPTAGEIVATDIDMGALGNLGGSKEAVIDYYANSRFEIQGLDPTKSYDLTFYGSHKFSTDNATTYSIYSDDTYTTLVDSATLNHQSPGNSAQHNRDQVATISGIEPQSNDILYVEFEGASGNFGYLNALQVEASGPPQPTSPKVYMHLMPWFDTPETLGANNWGIHWAEQGAADPNLIDANGKRQIASHYYPKIGPYQSSNPNVIEYQMLLMKMAGVDGVLIDWYGVQGTNGDIVQLFLNSDAIVDKADDFGLDFAVVLEDRFAANTSQVQANVEYLENNYFNRANYIRTGPGSDPLLPVFGPITQETPGEWNTILQNVQDVELLTLPGESGEPGTNATGEYSWIFENEALDNHLAVLENFLIGASSFGTAGGSAYPGFENFGAASFTIPHNNGQTLADTLALANQYESNYDFLQLATFNDFGEGTILEPTVETGFEYLKQIQHFTGVPYGEDELQLVFDLYRARVEFSGNSSIQADLDQASAFLTAYDISSAKAIIDSYINPGDIDNDNDVDGNDFLSLLRNFGSIGYYPENTLDADDNVDGQVEYKDIARLMANFGSNVGALSTASNVPEPTSLLLITVGGITLSILRKRS